MSFQKRPRKTFAHGAGTLFPLSECNELPLIGITKHQIKSRCRLL
jgi:hypothetical protein